MIHTLGVTLLFIGIAAMLAIAVLTALRMRRFARAARALRSHPLFEAEWREHQLLVARRLETAAERLRNDFGRLGPALAQLALSVEELGMLVGGTSRATEQVLRTGLPWLAGVLGPKY